MWPSIIFAVTLIGFTAIVGQIILLRELLVIFYGNELSTGTVLASWLLWTSLGSGLLGRVADRIRNKILVFAFTQILLSLILPISVLLVRVSNILWNVPTGEVVTIAKMMGISVTVLAPFCYLSGFLFALGCTLMYEYSDSTTKSVGRVYYYEAMGSACGGLLLCLIAIRSLNHTEICFAASTLLLISSLLLLRRTANYIFKIFPLLLICLFLSGLLFYGHGLDERSRRWEWKGHNLVASKDTLYGNIVVTSRGNQTNFYENGLWNFSYPDRFTAEESVHFALLQHPHPTTILLVGGGISSSLGEILKHPSIDRVDYVELDPELILLGKRHLPQKAGEFLEDARVHIFNTDGRAFIRRTKDKYDVVIVNLPDPMTAQLNRFYTLEFFREARNILNPDGIFYFGVTASEDIIGYTLSKFLISIHYTLKQVFDEVLVFPGGTARFFGALRKGILTKHPEDLVARLKDRGIDLTYVREYYIMFNLSQARLDYISSILAQERQISVNTDFNPKCYFYDLVLWGAQYSPATRDLFLKLSRIRLNWIIYGTALLTLIGSLASKLPRTKGFLSRGGLLYAITVMGFSGIGFEIIIILAFQILYGYMYYKMGILIAFFMLGLALGGLSVTQLLGRIRNPARTLIVVQISLALYSFVLGLTIVYLEGLSETPLIVEMGFPFLTFGAGVLGGCHFPLANSIYLGKERDVGRIGGLTYGMDLIGSSGGSLLISVAFVPLLGVFQTLLILTALNISASVLLFFCKDS
jgi:spermidine synthase